MIVENDKESIFQNEEKEKRAAELAISDEEVLFQNAKREKLASELAIANKELRTILENSGIGLILLDEHCSILQINNNGIQLCELATGIKFKKFDNFYSTVPEWRKEDLKKLFSKVLNGESLHYESVYPRPGGTKLILNVNFIPTKNNDGNVIGACLSMEDITERKKADNAVKESEAKYRAFFENSMDGILLTVTDGKILAANPAACEIFRMTEEEICNAGRFGIIDTSDTRAAALIRERELTGKAKGELTLVRKDGSKFPGEISSMLFIDSCGQERTSMIIRDISERKQVEEKISATSKSHQHALNDLNKIMDSSLDVICAVDAKGNFLKVSAASESVWGYKPEELIGMPLINFVYHEDNEKTQLTADQVMAGNNLGHFENRYVRKDGSLVPIEWSARWDENDKVRYGVARDVTEKKRLEKAIKAEQRRLSELFSNAPTAMTVLKGAGHVYEIANPLYLELIDKKDIIGKTVEQVLPEMVEQGFIRLLDRVYETGETFIANEMPVTVIQAGNKEPVDKYLNFVYQAYHNLENKVEGIFVFIIDVTEQVLSRKKIEKSELRYRSLIEQATDAICISDASMRLIDVNPAACLLSGYSKKEILQLSLPDILFIEDLKTNPFRIKNIEPGKTIWNERRLKRKDGIGIDMEVSTKIMEDGRFIMFGHDITERKKSEIRLHELNENLLKQTKELAVSNAELEQFAYVASHDLQEPLRMVTSFLTQLEKKYGNVIDDRGKKYIDFAVDGAKRMRMIILDLLEFSRVGRMEDKLEDIDLNEVVGEVQRLYRKQISEKNAVLLVDKLPVINSYNAPVRQVFQNLVSNALKYSRKDHPTRIQISVTESEEHWQFAVTDNGIGIAKDYFDKIFIIFQRLHNKDEFSGTGMGLSVTKKIIENLGGNIWVESEVGEGSTFYFTLPKK